MKYQEKIKYADEVVLALENGSTMDSLRAMLKEKNLYDGEIDQVMTSAKSMMEDEYGDRVLGYLKLGSLEVHKGEFSHLDPEILESLLFRANNKFKALLKTKVKQLMDQGLTYTQIVDQLSSENISLSEINTMYNDYKREDGTIISKSERNRFKTIGITNVLSGLFLAFFSISEGGNGILGIITIAGGSYYLIKASTPLED